MKKFTIMLAGLAMAAAPSFMQAQEQEPNRLLLYNTIGNRTGYVLDRVDSIGFARIDGEVKAEVDIMDVTLDSIVLSVKKTPDCYGFKINVLPAVIANAYNDLTLITYLNMRTSSPTFNEDFSHAQLTGVELQPSTDYVVVTVGIDGYGVEDGVVRAPITTPGIPLVGNPEVKAEVVDRQLKSFSVKFTPNDDVSDYYCVAGEKGTMQEQLEMFGPMMGLSSMTDLIMTWGVARSEEEVVEWTGMAPNEEYEVFYVALDKEGSPAPYQVLETSTLSLGGDGVAEVSMELGDYIYTMWGEELKPSQFITFEPNDQASCYRFSVYKAEIYDGDTEAIKQELCSDPPMPMAYWFFYDAMSTDFQIDPLTECVAIAAAKNANGEWGSVNELRFTTPEEPLPSEEGYAAPARKTSGKNVIKSRIKASRESSQFTPGRVPALAKPNKIELR